MLKIKQRTFLIALVALLAVFAGCKGESPTSPTTTTTTPGGGTPPPTGASVTLATSNATPLVDSSVTITATVKDNGQPVANGTAVQFLTTIGTFTEANATSVIRTTTNGIATVTLTSSTAGAATVTAAVNNVTAATTFTFQSTVLTPKITAVSPASGPIDGGTRVTIFGEGFQAPLQVFFGAAEASLASGITFNQLTVIAPTASLTNPNGSGVVLGPVDIKVINIASATSVTAPAAFRYIQKIQITAAGPTVGPAEGGTRIQIDGSGFNDPLTVTAAGVAASVISVSGTKVIAITSPVLLTACSDVTGPIAVTNIDNGDSANGPPFTYHVNKTTIVGISPSSVTAGGSLTITVAGQAAGTNKILLADQTAFVTNSVFNPVSNTTAI